MIEMLFDSKIKLIASALGPPPAWMIEEVRPRGVKVAALAGTVEHAKRHAAAGADINVAQARPFSRRFRRLSARRGVLGLIAVRWG